MLEAIAWFFGWLVGLFFYATAKIVLPLVSLGRLRVLPKLEAARAGSSGPATPPFQRLPSGYIGVRYDSACFIGFLIWGVVIVIAGLDFNY
jgi:hypothetical protein